MKLLRSLFLAAAVVLIASPVAAQNFQFLDANGTEAGWGTRVGPYHGRMLNGDIGGPTIDIFCVDYQRTVWNGVKWTASFTNLADLAGDASLVGNTYAGRYQGWGQTTAVESYMKAAWLATQFSLQPREDWADIHGTIWQIMSGGAKPDGWSPGDYWEVFDNDAWKSEVNLSEWTVITDVDGNRQEFLTRNVVPEPETLLLLGTGLVGLGLVFIRRRGLI